ncbi:helix-turn-helix domain-containing protein [Antrihabitans cavernicola]|uniref:Transcriptional regulator n=1 Tax=Antrihabitans cavernicola TaxID=2495913 RepID=A0A5A7S5R1_9NOCA|nr:helix-turn-helix domain-containing protein [Spelaeibacter cavernicola]KAA0020045.1 transcriptional regulator [Spelaeibacter cavernicola]
MTNSLVREEIALSWRRARQSGLQPADSLDSVPVSDVDRRSRLLAAANPVLDGMESVLDGSGYCVLLADRDAVLVDLRFGTNTRLHDVVSDTGAVLGRPFTEQTSGTNSIATVHELHAPLAVRGTEHYIEAMKRFSCYGYPLLHPATRRLEGVLDITFLAAEDNPLLEPMLTHAARDIAGRLLEETRWSEQLLFSAFQQASARRRGRAVIAIADELLLENTHAGQIVDAVDHAALRSLTDRAVRRSGVVQQMTLSSGLRASVRWERPVSGAGIVIEIDPCDDTHSALIGAWVPKSRRAEIPDVDSHVADVRRDRTTVCVVGEPGSGRTTTLAAIMADHEPRQFDSADLVGRQPAAWLATVEQALADPERPITIENVHLLPSIVARDLYEKLHASTAWFALSSTPAEALDHEHRHLVTGCRTTIALTPLRMRKHDIPELVRAMLTGLPHGDKIRFTPAAMTALIGYDWPGNIAELAAEVAAAAGRHSAGDITPDDLVRPRQTPPNGLTALDTALREAIVAELARNGGNKRNTAQRLGISPTTLYKRMRGLGIAG